jgi:glycosyltransferase involved in cell wall biosynthesis
LSEIQNSSQEKRLAIEMPQVLANKPVLPAELQNLPEISIVTPSYNQGRFLEDCITSVLDQNYPELEYIVIDGGSTDQSVDIIKKYEERITLWVSEPDEGQSDAINKGFRMATGELVAWLNADDFYLPGALATVAEAYRNNPGASFYFGDGLRVDEAGQPKSRFFPDGRVLFNQAALIFGIDYILQPATFINRTHLVKVNYLNPTLHYGLDIDLWIRLSQVAPPVPISACLAASREYDATKTATGSFQRVEELRHIAEKYSDLPMTPGTLWYFLDTLHRLAQEREDVFPKLFRIEIRVFWWAAAKLMAKYGARPDGFPASLEELTGAQANFLTKIGRKLKRIWVRTWSH